MIYVKDLTKIYKVPQRQGFFKQMFFPKENEILAVDKISFSIEEGESIALLGPNGAGKTTTLKMLTGILYPSSGEISIMGFKPIERKPMFLQNIGFVMGSKAILSWDLTAWQNFELNEAIYNIPHDQFVKSVKDLSEILDSTKYLDRPVRNLSLGQRMKIELIGSLLHNPKILFLDEPTIGLDVVSQQSMREFIKKINKDYGTTIILTSHNMEDIQQVSERVIIINNGQIIYDDSINALTKNYSKNKYVKITFREHIKDIKPFENYGKILEKNDLSVLLELDRDKQGSVLSTILSEYDVDDIDITGVPLTQIMTEIFQKEKS